MKKAKLYEEFVNTGNEHINEAAGPSREILGISKKFQIGARAGIPKNATRGKHPWSYIGGSDPNQIQIDDSSWNTLNQRLDRSGVGEVLGVPSRQDIRTFDYNKREGITMTTLTAMWEIGQFFTLEIEWSSDGGGHVILKEKIADRKIKAAYIYGEINELTDMTSDVLQSNIEILRQLSGYGNESDLPMSIVQLKGNRQIISMMNRLRDQDPETIIKGSLLDLFYKISPEDRKEYIEDMISILKDYSKDSEYLKAVPTDDPRLI